MPHLQLRFPESQDARTSKDLSERPHLVLLFYPHLTDEKTELQGGQTTHLPKLERVGPALPAPAGHSVSEKHPPPREEAAAGQRRAAVLQTVPWGTRGGKV